MALGAWFRNKYFSGMESDKKLAAGACDHVQPSEVADMAETYLREKAIPLSLWEDCRFGFGGKAGAGAFKSIYIEVIRRSGNWVAVKLDRRKTEMNPEQAGLKVVRVPEIVRDLLDASAA